MVQLDLHAEYVRIALEDKIASLKRSTTKQKNAAINQLINQDIAAYSHALNTIQDIPQTKGGR
jgi:hypothetical protein